MTLATIPTHTRSLSRPDFAFSDESWTQRVLDQERAGADLQTGRWIRASLLERARVGETSLLNWASYSRAGRVVGGGFHELTPRRSGGLDVVLGDVTAKGLPAALMGASCLNQVLRAMATLGPDARPSEILSRTSQALAADPASRQASPGLDFIRLDGDPLTLTLAHAGHAHVAIRSLDGSVFEPQPFAARAGTEGGFIPESSLALSPGDMVLIFTDEMAALARSHARIFNAAAWLSECDGPTPSGVVAALGREIERFYPSGDAQDRDVTFVAIGVKPPTVFV